MDFQEHVNHNFLKKEVMIQSRLQRGSLHAARLSFNCILFPPSGHLNPSLLVFLLNVPRVRRRCSALLNQTSTSRAAKANRVMTALTAATRGYLAALRASLEPTPASLQRNAVEHLKRTSGLLSRPAGVKLLGEIPRCVRDV